MGKPRHWESKQNVIFKAEGRDIDKFDELFPMYGAKQWFFEGCLLKLLELHEAGKVETPVDLLALTVKEIGDKL